MPITDPNIIGLLKNSEVELIKSIVFKNIDDIKHPEKVIWDDTYMTELKTQLGDKYAILYYVVDKENIYQQGGDIIEKKITGEKVIKTVFIPAPIIKFTRKKTVIRNVVNGIPTSVYEVMNSGELDINMTFSFVTQQTWVRTNYDIFDFFKVAEYVGHLYIANPFLNDNFNIHKVVLKNYTISPNKQYSNVVDISLSLAHEDEYFDLFELA